MDLDLKGLETLLSTSILLQSMSVHSVPVFNETIYYCFHWTIKRLNMVYSKTLYSQNGTHDNLFYFGVVDLLGMKFHRFVNE